MNDGRKYHETRRARTTLREDIFDTIWFLILGLTIIGYVLVAGAPVPR